MGPTAGLTLRNPILSQPLSRPYLANDDEAFYNINRMSDSVVKLVMDGANWATYWDRLELTLNAHRLEDHLSNNNVTKSYTDARTISGNSPASE